MVRDIKFLARPFTESLFTAPSHVLDCHESSISEKDPVQLAMYNNGTINAFDDTRERMEGRIRRRICVQNAVGALGPFFNRGIDGLLHVCAVEVDEGALGYVFEGAWEAEHIPQHWTRSGNGVDIETWVCEEDRIGDIIPQCALGVVFSRDRSWKVARWWKCEIIVDVVGIPTFVGARMNVVHEGFIEVEEFFPVVHIRDGRDCGFVS